MAVCWPRVILINFCASRSFLFVVKIMPLQWFWWDFLETWNFVYFVMLGSLVDSLANFLEIIDLSRKIQFFQIFHKDLSSFTNVQPFTHITQNPQKGRQESKKILNLFILECTTINRHGRSVFYNHLPGKVKAFE